MLNAYCEGSPDLLSNCGVTMTTVNHAFTTSMKIFKRRIGVVCMMGLNSTFTCIDFFLLGGRLHPSDFFPVYSL